MAYKQKSPLPIKEGGTNAVSMANTYGVNYFDGSALLTTAVGTATHVLTSNGAGVAPTFQAAGGGTLTATVVLTSAEVKALRATPIDLIAAPGSGNIIQILQASCKMTYGGSNVFAGGLFSTICTYYGAPSVGIVPLMGKFQVVSPSSQYYFTTSSTPSSGLSAMENTKIVISNSDATEFSGNASNDNTVTVVAYYRIVAV